MRRHFRFALFAALAAAGSFAAPAVRRKACQARSGAGPGASCIRDLGGVSGGDSEGEAENGADGSGPFGTVEAGAIAGETGAMKR